MANKQSKRKIESIDLTQDDDEEAYDTLNRKHARHNLPSPPSSNRRSFEERERWQEEDMNGDAGEEVESAQEFDEDAYHAMELYGTLNTKVVGIQYYRGQATVGERVLIKREPANPYDRNAIRIDNVMGHQIGHIPRRMAEKLATFMDSGALLVEGLLTAEKGFYDVPIALKLFGTSEPEKQATLKEQMQDAKLPISDLTQAQRERKKQEKEREKKKQQERTRLLKQAASRAGGVGVEGSGAQRGNKSNGWSNLAPGSDGDGELSMEDIINSSTTFNPREIGEIADKYGSGEEVLSKLPLAKQPTDLATELLPYQLQGLAWMLDRENLTLPQSGSDDTVQLWRCSSKGLFTNIATNYTAKDPQLASGGILADDMGLGKTIQIISLMVADPHRTKQPTLIVCPLSVMSNWSGQIRMHLKQNKNLSVLTYHGSNRTEKRYRPEDFEGYDVVITTYQTMSIEWMPRGSNGKAEPVPRSDGLHSVNWRRVVLDEGHNIRNPKAKMAQAACALLSQSRWILTGTPIVNNLRDLYSHVKFLRLSGGLEQQDIFSGALIRPLSQGRSEATVLLQALMGTICLRRMKDMKFVDLRLPELTSHKYTVSWLSHEREKYEAFQAEAKGLLLQYQRGKDGAGKNTYSHLLEVLLRLRQTCNHWKLAGDRIAKLMDLVEQNKKVELNPQNLKALQELLQLSIDSQEDCPVCLESLHSPVITSCSHVFGGECIERVIEMQHKCPMCRAELEDKGQLVQPAAGLGEQADPGLDIETSSSKVEALLSILKATSKKKGTKTVVFSQWTSFLDVIQAQLVEQGYSFCRLDGKMTAQTRDEAMDALTNDPACTIMLASLHVCSVGLNLNAANQVILADSWWAPAIEDQAVDRVHRLGQKRPTTVFRLVMEDSIEERVLEIQQEKRKLMMTAFQEKTSKRGNEKAARLADIEKLIT